ncbi:uncharacterized protein LOC101862896 [Aplysia californica]|uniref:Uncharacterized protein LOC101862896 n=1 Tax=Aplysia californica TaxID=6500 RepID=A0ABM1A986_APLCA|nr:uncharacterized protein LOC101862896 [Aplysia californica]
MVWSYTISIGCSAVVCPSLTTRTRAVKDAMYLVCYYYPRGNMMGVNPYTRGQSCSKCASGDTCSNRLCMSSGPESKLAPDIVKMLPNIKRGPWKSVPNKASYNVLLPPYLSPPTQSSRVANPLIQKSTYRAQTSPARPPNYVKKDIFDNDRRGNRIEGEREENTYERRTNRISEESNKNRYDRQRNRINLVKEDDSSSSERRTNRVDQTNRINQANRIDLNSRPANRIDRENRINQVNRVDLNARPTNRIDSTNRIAQGNRLGQTNQIDQSRNGYPYERRTNRIEPDSTYQQRHRTRNHTRHYDVTDSSRRRSDHGNNIALSNRIPEVRDPVRYNRPTVSTDTQKRQHMNVNIATPPNWSNNRRYNQITGHRSPPSTEMSDKYPRLPQGPSVNQTSRRYGQHTNRNYQLPRNQYRQSLQTTQPPSTRTTVDGILRSPQRPSVYNQVESSYQRPSRRQPKPVVIKAVYNKKDSSNNRILSGQRTSATTVTSSPYRSSVVVNIPRQRQRQPQVDIPIPAKRLTTPKARVTSPPRWLPWITTSTTRPFVPRIPSSRQEQYENIRNGSLRRGPYTLVHVISPTRNNSDAKRPSTNVKSPRGRNPSEATVTPTRHRGSISRNKIERGNISHVTATSNTGELSHTAHLKPSRQHHFSRLQPSTRHHGRTHQSKTSKPRERTSVDLTSHTKKQKPEKGNNLLPQPLRANSTKKRVPSTMPTLTLPPLVTNPSTENKQNRITGSTNQTLTTGRTHKSKFSKLSPKWREESTQYEISKKQRKDKNKDKDTSDTSSSDSVSKTKKREQNITDNRVGNPEDTREKPKHKKNKGARSKARKSQRARWRAEESGSETEKKAWKYHRRNGKVMKNGQHCGDRHPACSEWKSKCSRSLAVKLTCPFSCGKCEEPPARMVADAPRKRRRYTSYHVQGRKRNPKSYHRGRRARRLRNKKRRHKLRRQNARFLSSANRYLLARRRERRRRHRLQNLSLASSVSPRGTTRVTDPSPAEECQDDPKHAKSCQYWAKLGSCQRNVLISSVFCRWSCASCG